MSEDLDIFSCLVSWVVLMAFVSTLFDNVAGAALIPVGYLLGRWLGDRKPMIIKLREVIAEFNTGNKLIMFRLFGRKK